MPSVRQLRVIELVAQGLKNREIAEKLGISHGVVKNYLRNIHHKIGLTIGSNSRFSIKRGCMSGKLPAVSGLLSKSWMRGERLRKCQFQTQDFRWLI